MEIVISIKPEYVKLILEAKKNYEFRNYIPKQGVHRLWVYTSSPTKKLEYVIDIDNIISYPKLINEDGIGNDIFNKGNGYKHAYHIKHLYSLEKPLDLRNLKENFNFNAPQSYFYLDNYLELKDYLNNINLNKIF